jgi:hypothetical protein
MTCGGGLSSFRPKGSSEGEFREFVSSGDIELNCPFPPPSLIRGTRTYFRRQAFPATRFNSRLEA